jgi:hypothetical protein
MALELLAAVIAAFALGGIMYGLRRKLGERIPKWSVPAAAALGLISVTLVSEYGWFSRVSGRLPEGVEVVWTEGGSSPLRPWTFAVPMTLRFIALDTRTVAAHPTQSGLRSVTLYRIERWRPVDQAILLVDCAGARRVMLTEGVTIDDAGTLVGAEWVAADKEDPFLTATCKGS